MKMRDAFKRARAAMSFVLGTRVEDTHRSIVRGDVFLTVKDAVSGEVLEQREMRNLVVKDASILVARLMKDSVEAPHGAFCLAVGTGDTGWTSPPPAATDTQRALYAEVSRKTFSSTTFVDSGGSPTGVPTNVVDFTATFAESEGVGALMEMGIIGGNVNSDLNIRNPVSPANGPYDASVNLTSYETLVNYLTFGVVTKPATSVMTITWRLTF